MLHHPDSSLGSFRKPITVDFCISRSQLAVALPAGPALLPHQLRFCWLPQRAATACRVPKGMGSTPRPTCQPTAARCALGGHPGLSRFGQVSRQHEHVLARGVIWDGRACPAWLARSDTQFLRRCDPRQAARRRAQACLGEQSRAECSPGCSPVFSRILEHYLDFIWSITSCGKKAQDEYSALLSF